MKKIFYLLIAILISVNLCAGKLVLVKTHSYQELKMLSTDVRTTLNYL